MDIDAVYVTSPVKYWELILPQRQKYKGTLPSDLDIHFVCDKNDEAKLHALKVVNNTLHIMQAHILRYYYFDMFPQPHTRFDKDEKLKKLREFIQDVTGGAEINQSWYTFMVHEYQRYFPELPHDYQSLLSL
jgi:hypothetical protein